MESRYRGLWHVLLLTFVCVALPLQADDAPSLQLKSLYWPPYTGESLDSQGELTATVHAKLTAQGFRPSTEFVPWASILSHAEHGFQPVDAFFPAYPSHRYLSFCELSQPIGSSPLGIIHHRDHPPTWQQLSDLSPLILGVVRGYANTEDIDALIQLGALQTEVARSDLQNIIKVATRRVDAAIIDRNVFEWLLKHDSRIAGIDKEVTFHPKLLAQQSLHVCVLKGPYQEQILNAFR